MKTLKDIQPGLTVTVQKVGGGRKIQDDLERRGVMSGTDLTVLETLSDGSVRTEMFRGELVLTPAEAEQIKVGEHFVRHSDDPVLLCGCCAGAYTAEIMERMETVYRKDQK